MTGDRTDGRLPTSAVVLRSFGALTLGWSAYLHLRIASERPPLLADGQVTLSGLFLAQGAVASLVVVWVVLRGSRAAWLAFAAVAAASLMALLVSVYVQVPAIGPLPSVYEPVWYPDKVASAVAAALATAVALVALLRRRPTSEPASRDRGVR